jgi:hypothetical protein
VEEEKERQYSRFAKLNEYTSDSSHLRPNESGKYLGCLGFTEAARTMHIPGKCMERSELLRITVAHQCVGAGTSNFRIPVTVAF